MTNPSLSLVSPGVQFSVQDLSYVVQAVGVTTLGLVGETLKGPAFQPVSVINPNDFATKFGAQSAELFGNGVPKYELPYIANSYLQESNQLYVTRILGLSGYDAGKAWVITTSAAINPASISTAVSTGVTTFTGNTFSNATINANVSNFTTLPITAINSAATFTVSSATTLTKSSTAFTATQIILNVTAFNSSTSAGTANYVITGLSGTSLSAYENIPVALVRSRADYVSDTKTFRASAVTMSTGATSNALAQFNLVTNNNTLMVSLDQTQTHFIGKVLGYAAFDKKVDLYVEDVYPNLIASLVSGGKVFGLNNTLINYTNLNNYQAQYQTPETPFFVSEVRGNQIERLFKLISISDGNAANSEIKISIENINFATGEFDVCVRDFNDTDAYPSYFETFRKCTMNPLLTSYVAKRIGTSDAKYTLISNYVMVELDPMAPSDALPCGFEGYICKNFTGNLPSVLYKNAYSLTDKVNKVFLGFSDTVGIDQDLFNFQGVNISTGLTAGFHMDSGATGSMDTGTTDSFITGNYQFNSEASVAGTPLAPLNARKFVCGIAGGFDGWDIFRTTRTNSDAYINTSSEFTNAGFTLSYPSDYYAYLNAINTFADASDLFINLFATPGIDYNYQTSLIQETIDMVQDVRGDCFYVITSPNLDPTSSTAAQDEVDLLSSTGIDATYATTFFPWVQYNDTQNNANIWLPPTYEYVRLAAQTDNQQAPWFAVAGYNRGQLQSTLSEIKINQSSADILYQGRINPVRSYPGSQLMLWGNKTLQVANSALSSSNVARLLLQLKKLVSNVAIRLVFEPNDTTLQQQFLTLVKPILASVKTQRGVIDFQVTCDGTNNTSQTADQLELVGSIRIKPTLAAEYINVGFSVTDQGASFSVAS